LVVTLVYNLTRYLFIGGEWNDHKGMEMNGMYLRKGMEWNGKKME